MADRPLFVAASRTGHQIRLTPAAWRKIQRDHPEFSGGIDYLEEVRRTLEDPDYLVVGWEGADLALRWCEIAPGSPKHVCVVYRELERKAS